MLVYLLYFFFGFFLFFVFAKCSKEIYFFLFLGTLTSKSIFWWRTSGRRVWRSWWRHRVENTSVLCSCLWILDSDFWWVLLMSQGWKHFFLAFCLSLGLGQRLWQVLVMSQLAFELSFNKNYLKWRNLTVFANKMALWLFGKIEVFELGLMSLPGLNLFVVRCWRLTEDFDLNWQLDWSFLWKIDELATSFQSWFWNSGLDWTLLWHGFLKPGLPPRNKVRNPAWTLGYLFKHDVCIWHLSQS